MLARLRDDLTFDFMQAEAFEVEDCAALNVAFMRLTRSPYFEGGNDRFELFKTGDSFFQVYEHRHQEWKEEDPLRNCYETFSEEWDDEEGVPPARPPLLPPKRYPYPQAPQAPHEGPLPASVETRAQAIRDRFLTHHPEWGFLGDPSSSLMDQRHHMTFETFEGADALHNRLRTILGPHHDVTLNLDGIRYHHPHWSHRDPDQTHRYLLAHNGQEVAGLVHYLHRPRDNGLAFISVAPGFRRRGLSHRLYQAFMDQCTLDQCLVKRTDPGEFARENPGITRGYDRLLAQGQVLHVTGHGFLYNALLAALAQHPYERVLEAGKKVCDQACQHRQTLGPWAYDTREADHLDTEAFQANLAALTPAPAPVRRRRCR